MHRFVAYDKIKICTINLEATSHMGPKQEIQQNAQSTQCIFWSLANWATSKRCENKCIHLCNILPGKFIGHQSYGPAPIRRESRDLHGGRFNLTKA